jgi:hypothetical protein
LAAALTLLAHALANMCGSFDLSAIALPFFLLALAQPHARPAAVVVDASGCVRPNLPFDADRF